MLYKKNSSKTLSKELFKNPTSEYRGTPFWAWNDYLTKEELQEVANYHNNGLHNNEMDLTLSSQVKNSWARYLKENNDTFSKKLQLNYLTGSDGDRIRNDLVNLIDGTNGLDDILEMRNSLEHKLDDMVETRGKLNYDMLIGLSNELIGSLNDIVGDKQINDSFKEKLYFHNLGEEYWSLIKDEITQLINREFIEPDFESRMKNLKDLKSK